MRKWTHWGKVSLLASSALFLVGVSGCEEAEKAANDVAEQCNLECSSKGIVEGNASISGIASVDAFFGAVVNFNTTANQVSGNIEAQLAKIRSSLGLSASATPDQIIAKIKTEYELDGALKIAYKPPQCGVSAQATLEATARCEAEFDPGSAKVECQGACEVDASAEVDCGVEAELKCVGTAPNLECEGSCEGACELDVAAKCEGTCNGTCEGTCSVEGPNGECAGTCDGECKGTCQLTAGGSCSGKCKGECTYTPPEASCTGSASARCEAKGSAKVECSGRCEGEIVPPKASAECEASAKAEAQVRVECTPPSVDIEYAFKANASADAEANFEAFLVRFRSSLSIIAAELARADVVLKAGADLRVAATGAVQGAVDAKGNLSLKEKAGLVCAVKELPRVATAINGSATKLSGSVETAGSLTGKLVAGS